MTAVVGYLALAAIAAVLCFSRRGRELLAAAGDALAVVVDDVLETESSMGAPPPVKQLGALAEERDRENVAACRAVKAPEPPASNVIPFVATVRWQSIESSKDERWLM